MRAFVRHAKQTKRGRGGSAPAQVVEGDLRGRETVAACGRWNRGDLPHLPQRAPRRGRHRPTGDLGGDQRRGSAPRLSLGPPSTGRGDAAPLGQAAGRGAAVRVGARLHDPATGTLHAERARTVASRGRSRPSTGPLQPRHPGRHGRSRGHRRGRGAGTHRGRTRRRHLRALRPRPPGPARDRRDPRPGAGQDRCAPWRCPAASGPRGRRPRSSATTRSRHCSACSATTSAPAWPAGHASSTASSAGPRPASRSSLRGRSPGPPDQRPSPGSRAPCPNASTRWNPAPLSRGPSV